MVKKVANVISDKRVYNNGIHTDKTGTKGSRARRNRPEIEQSEWDRIFKKKEKPDGER